MSGKVNDTFKLDIPGRFSAYNALCAISVAYELGIDTESMKRALEKVKVLGIHCSIFRLSNSFFLKPLG